MLRTIFLVLTIVGLLPGCYVYNYFKEEKGGGGGGDVFTGTIIGQSIGNRAGGVDEAALAAVHAVGTPHAPAAIRPDPDLFVRRLLRQYRPEGAIVARQIGQVEQYRLLLGGATEDFAKAPQESYDATSLLAVFKVAEEVCRGLVAPNPREHGDWQTIMPLPAAQERANVVWLAQRFIGKPSNQIDAAVIDSLIAIMRAEEAAVATNWWAMGQPYAKYIAVCATLALDAEAMYL